MRFADIIRNSPQFPEVREYSDREPIMAADDVEEYSNSHSINVIKYGLPEAHPSPNMFDDL